MTRFKLWMVALFAALGLFVAGGSVTHATGPWYVATTGNDSNDCLAVGSPCLTIGHAITLASAGDIINVAAGTYAEQVTITKSLDLIGAGAASTTIQAPALRTGSVTTTSPSTVHDYVLAAYALSGTIDVRIAGFTIDVHSQNKTAGTARIDGVFFRDVTDTGGTTAGLFSSIIHGFAATPDYESWGLAVYGASLLTVNANTISDYTRDGLLVVGGNVTISGNTITGSATPLNGINIQDVTAGSVTGNTVTGNIRSDPWAAGGIVLWSSSGVTVESNHVNGNFYGIDLEPGTSSVTISGNHLTDNVKRAISLDGANNNTVSANTITGPAAGTDDTAIGLASSATGNTIGGDAPTNGNTISMATSGTGNLYAIYMQADVASGSNTIKNNTITGGQRAVQFDGPPGITGLTTVASNTISGQGYGGITAYNNGNLTISNNTLTNTVRPIEFFGPVNVSITGNTINGATDDGINAGSASGTVTISGNHVYNVSAASAVHAQAGTDNITINNNELDHSNIGIQVDTGSIGDQLTNNNIHDNTWSAASINEAVASLTGNTITNNARGIEAGHAIAVHNNSIVGNADCQLCLYATATYDASSNWWGTTVTGTISSLLAAAANGNAFTYTPYYVDAARTILSNNADLASLSLSGLTLSPAFSAGTTSYTASVDNSVTSVTVTPGTNPGANAIVTGGSSLSIGSNIVTVAVTSADGTMTNTYTVTVTRSAPQPPEPPAPPTTGTETLPTGTTTVTSTLDTSDTVATVTSSGTITTGTGTQDIATFAWYSTDGTTTSVDLTPPQDVGGGISVTVGMAVMLSSGTAGEPITLTTTAMPNVSVTIPDTTNVLAPAGWDGKINPPTVGTSEGTPPSGFSVGSTVVEVGSSTAVLLFDHPASVVLTGVTGAVGYRPAGSDTWVEISPCGASGPVFPGACSQSDGVNTTILTYHFSAFASLIATSIGALPTQHFTEATSTGLNCFAYSGPATPATAFAAYFSSGVTSVNRFNLPAGNYSSWFRAAPSLATLATLASGEIICVDGPAGTGVFTAATMPGVILPVTPPATPATVTTATTVTGVYCFAYSGPATAVANFTTRFNSAIVAINRLNLPDGKFSSWFSAAPSLSTIVSLSNGDLLCVAGPSATSVFDTSGNAH